jgi:hypothetical protein
MIRTYRHHVSLSLAKAYNSLNSADEDPGMSPQLERALCEALEEQLSHELAHVMAPIMTKIKGRIPAIIESCREKLKVSPPSLDDKTVSASSGISSVTGSSVTGSSNSECGSSTSQNRPWSNSVTSLATSLATSLSSDDASGDPVLLESIARSCAASMQVLQPQDVFLATSGVHYDTRETDQHDPPGCFQCSPGVNGYKNAPSSEQGVSPYTCSDVRPESSRRTIRRKPGFLLSNRQNTMHETYGAGQDFTHQNFPSTLDYPYFDWPTIETGWGQRSMTQEDPGGRHLESDLTQQSAASGEWQSFVEEFDMNCHRQ